MMQSTRNWFRAMITERRAYPKGSPDWEWRTRAARQYLNIIRGLPIKAGLNEATQ